jgi:hypothetical protein
MDKALVDQGVDKGLGLLGERIGELGVNQMRDVARRAEAQGGYGNWMRRQPSQAAAVALLLSSIVYAFWAFRRQPSA